MKDYLALILERRTVLYIVIVLTAALALLIVGAADTIKFGERELAVGADWHARLALLGSGLVFVIVGLVLIVRDSGRRASKAERALLAYYAALNEVSTDGFEHAWNMLSASKKARFSNEFGWTTSSEFRQGFVSTMSHDPVFLRREASSETLETFLVVFIANEEYPASPAREILLGTDATPVSAAVVLESGILDAIQRRTLEALKNSFDAGGRTDDTLAGGISGVLAGLDMQSLLSVDLVESVGLRLQLLPKSQKKVKNASGSLGRVSKVRVVNVQRRNVVRESNDWKIGDVHLLGNSRFVACN